MKQKANLAVLLVITFNAQALAQQPAASPPKTQQSTPQTSGRTDDEDVVRITTSLVQLDFVVTDKRGNLVTDLTADDIEVFEDGRAQKISNFSYISTEPTGTTTAESTVASPPAEKSTPPPAVRRENVRRTIAIVVDDLGLSFQTLVPARAALRNFVEQQMQPGDLVAVIRTGGEVGALQQFTNDKRQLLAAIERLRWNPCSRRGINTIAPLRQDRLTVGNLIGGTRGGSVGTEAPPCSSYTLAATLEALRFIIGGLRELPGRKSVIILSDSIPIDMAEPSTTGGGALSLGVNSTPFPSTLSSDRRTENTDRRSYSDPLRRISEMAIRVHRSSSMPLIHGGCRRSTSARLTT